MIPYQEMTVADFFFYWGESVLYYRYKGTWIPVMPHRSGDEVERHTLENTKYMMFRQYDDDSELFTVPALDPFQSKDWITYEPPLGYFMLGGRLMLISTSVPRTRYKGLHPMRINRLSPVDACLLPPALLKWLPAMVTHSYENMSNALFAELVKAVASRANNPLPESWHQLALTGLRNVSPFILSHKTAVIPEATRGYGYLLHEGTMLGQLHLSGKGKNTGVQFIPRVKPTSSIEEVVHGWVRSKLLSFPSTTNKKSLIKD